MNFRRIALMVAILAVPCTANAFWFGSNGSCGGHGGCGSSCCESSCNGGHGSCGSHGGSFGGCFHHLFSHASCGSCGGWSMGCGCASSCGCGHESCGCGHEASSCGCGGEVSHEDGDHDGHAPAPMKEDRHENREHKSEKKSDKK